MMRMKNEYSELIQRQRVELSKAPIYWAFGKKQLDEKLKSLGLTGTGDILGVGSGGFILKTYKDEYLAMLARHEAELKSCIAADVDGRGFIRQMFTVELRNREFQWTLCISDTLDALGLTLREVEENAALHLGLRLAMKELDA